VKAIVPDLIFTPPHRPRLLERQVPRRAPAAIDDETIALIVRAETSGMWVGLGVDVFAGVCLTLVLLGFVDWLFVARGGL
jgi:hypothetical protein